MILTIKIYEFMKNIILVCSLFLTISFDLLSQIDINQLPTTVPTEKGNFIYLGNVIPRDFTYRLERGTSTLGKFEKIVEITAPSTRKEFDENRQKYSEYFENIPRMKDLEADYIWSQFQEGKPIDSIQYIHHAMTFLGLGLAYFDPIDSRVGEYGYKIIIQDDNGNATEVKEIESRIMPDKIEFPQIVNERSEYMAGMVIITWRLSSIDNFGSFNIYRRPYAEGEYLKINNEELNLFIRSEEGIYYVELMEEVGEEAVWNEYFIAPVDVYGREGERQAYAEGGNIKDKYIPPFMETDAVSDDEGHTVRLTWSYEMKDYLTGLSILRSEDYDDGYSRIVTLEPTDTTFTDILPITGENYYYRLVLHGVMGTTNESPTIFVAYTGSSEPPMPPKHLKAEPMENGVRLSWNDSESAFQIGYYVYRRENALNEFELISNLIPDSEEIYTYADTSSSLKSSTIYEYVVRTFNQDRQMSENSDTVTAYPLIKVKLRIPGDLRYSLRGNVAYVYWEDQTELGENILGYKVYRKFNDGDWEIMNQDSIQPRKNFYNDTTLFTSGTYTYGISAWDLSGNQSEMGEIIIVKEKEPLVSPPGGISVMQTSKGIYIRWGQMSGNITGFNIYRSESETDPVLIGTVSADEYHFIDENIEDEALYFYQLSAIDNNGEEGRKSDAEIIRIRRD